MNGLKENRLRYIVGVARKCYSLALERGHDEDFAKKMFMIGYLHDVGYEFTERNYGHPEESASLAKLIGCSTDVVQTIEKHGKYGNTNDEEYVILNTADMLIDKDGNEVDVYERLEDIKKRYGEWSDTYLTACDICYSLGLTSINLGA